MGKKESEKVIPDVVHLLPREIRALTQWGLRAARIPSGYSPAAEKMVLDCELFQQRGLTELHTFLLENKEPAVRVHLISDTGDVAQIRAQNQNVLVCAPAVFDFAYARARKNGRFLITGQDLAGGFPFLAELAADIAQRGLACAVLWSSENEAGATVALPSDTVGVNLYSAPTGETTAAHLLCHSAKLNSELPHSDECLPSLFATVDTPLLDTSLQNSFSIFCQTTDYFDVAKWNAELESHWGVGQTKRGRAELSQTAEDVGVQVQGHLWDELKTYGNQILIEA